MREPSPGSYDCRFPELRFAAVTRSGWGGGAAPPSHGPQFKYMPQPTYASPQLLPTSAQVFGVQLHVPASPQRWGNVHVPQSSTRKLPQLSLAEYCPHARA